MEENKQEILDKLLPALQATRNLYDLTKLEYVQKSPDFQYVEATFASGYRKHVNVTADSGTAMIRDVVMYTV